MAIVFDPVWQCIYCGHVPENRKELGKEHILPLSLGGIMILPRASCKKCSDTTRDFEHTCGRTIFGNFRLAASMPTRNPEQRPQFLPLTEMINGEEVTRLVPLEEYPITGGLPDIAPPGALLGLPSAEGFIVRPRVFIFAKKLSEHQAKFSHTLSITPFVKMLAKSAHALVVAKFGLNSYDWLLPNLIIGDSVNHPDFIGGAEDIDSSAPDFLLPPGGHAGMVTTWQPSTTLSIEEVQSVDGTRYLSVRIQLFFDFSPQYRVLVAKI
ncbi:HNH endonuclease [Pseudotabrizicola sp. 4114]|uniref:HNH endonuclease n=1 Tax=Pseudotabrizicola sp. 4114 TaxID=2817731 RepID=UPI0032B815DE